MKNTDGLSEPIGVYSPALSSYPRTASGRPHDTDKCPAASPLSVFPSRNCFSDDDDAS